jgi:hypothetical protein
MLTPALNTSHSIDLRCGARNLNPRLVSGTGERKGGAL